MQEFKTSLLREKFILHPLNEDEEPIVALSNRISIPLKSDDGIDDETFIVRTQNMHSCAKLAGSIVKEFMEHGSLIERARPLKWELLWGDVIKGYEKDWNPNIWCAIYHKGRVVFQYGTHHAFLDIIEKCDIANKGEYIESIKFAESAFGQAGKQVRIEHDSNVALVSSTSSEKAKCGIIVRTANGTTTFNYTSTAREDSPLKIHPYTTMTVAAAFLEAIQLSFQVGFMNKKQQFKLIEQYSDEERQHRRASNRLANLNKAIGNYEDNFTVNYRPDRPTIKDMVQKAEDYAVKILKPQIEEKFADGTLNSKDWVL
jgi:hypothetical protein